MPPRPREISSPKNPLVQRFRDAARGDLPDVLLAEGVRLVAEGLAEGIGVVDAAVSPAFTDSDMRQQLATRAQNFVECTDDVLQRLSQLETHQGLAVLFSKPKWQEAELLRGDLAPLVVVAAGVRDPGNLGSLLRTAEAAGATGCLVMAGGADPFRDKAVRGSMGSVFRLPTLHGFDAAAVIAFARRHA
ncbi:MAG TPA: TrmH family RNA methyltransferase, partial [Planctomycetota bacterium]|nr:TrmH family RNA methyltransferase [Planctomycetota bacterium]